MTEPIKPLFRSPEEIAPELGMTKTELRRYCRISPDHCTRLSNNRIMLDADNVAGIIAWVKARSADTVNDDGGKVAPFA